MNGKYKAVFIIQWIFIIVLLTAFFAFEDKMNLFLKITLMSLIMISMIIVIVYNFFKIGSMNKQFFKERKIAKEVLTGSIKLLERFYKLNKDNFKLTLDNKLLEFLKHDIEEKADEFSLKMEEFLAMTDPDKINLKTEITGGVQDGMNIDAMLIKQKFRTDIIVDLIKSIIMNTENVSGPLSDSIFHIKSEIKEFLEDINKWKSEFNDEKSEKNFTNIINKFDEQNKNFENVFMLINKNYLHMERNFDKILNMVEKIVINTVKIDEVSEKIRLLSVNASIEAARAGEYGKGFKIVSNEVKKLSNETQNSIKEILPLTNDTKITVNSSISEYNTELMTIINMINKEKDEFRVFYEILKNYYTDLNNLFTSVSDIINNINGNIDGLIPLFQFSNLSIQELDNLIKIINNYIPNRKSSIDTILSSMDDKSIKNIIEDLISEVKSEITTESEIVLINKLSEKYDLDIEKIGKKKGDGVELF